MRKSKFVVKCLKIITLVIVFGLIGKYLWDNFDKLQDSKFDFDILIFILSLGIYLLYKFGNAILWHLLASKNGAKISADKAILAWSYSQLGKYLPGKVFYLIGRVYFYKKENIEIKQVTFCFLLENAYTFISAVFIFVLSLPFSNSHIFKEYKFSALYLLLIFIVFFNPFFMKQGMKLVTKLFKREVLSYIPNYRDMVSNLLLFSSDWLIMGIGFVILSNSVYVLPITYFAFLVGAFALANVVGILSIFTPSGIGVREAVLVMALKEIMPLPQAIIISILSRVWITIGELIVPLLALSYSSFKKYNVGFSIFKKV